MSTLDRETTNEERWCYDCFAMMVNGEADPNWTTEEHNEHIALMSERDALEGSYMVSPGRLCTDPCEDECGSDEAGFSWSPCDGCGSHLGGDRFYVTRWFA